MSNHDCLEKVCNYCKILKCRDQFAYTKRDGLSNKCKNCRRLYYLLNKEREISVHREYVKINFTKVSSKQKERYRLKRDSILSKCKDYRALNKKEIAERRKLNNEKTLEKAREYRRKNKEVLRKKSKIYQKENSHVFREIASRRRATKLNATPKWLTKEELLEIKEMYQLAKELSWLSQKGLEVDHIVPLRGKEVCGLHVPWNLRIIPAEDNWAKGNRLIP